VRAASPPATTARAGTAEGSTAGERSGRGAVPGPAQDAESSTVDQSREWPYRDTAPRQDPAEARVDPIWGADPPDSVRWHMDMTADQATSGSSPAAAPTDTQGSAASASAPRPDQHPSAGPPVAGAGTPPALAPAGGSPSERQDHSAVPSRAETEQAAGLGGDQASALAGSPSGPVEEGPSGQDTGSAVGWFSTDPTSFTGSFAEQLSAHRPVDAPSHAQGTEAEASSQDAAAGAEAGPVVAGAVGPVESRGPGGSDAPVGSEGAADAVLASHGADAEPGRQGIRGPELIEAGMVYVDPDPEIGASPVTAERLEGSGQAASGTERTPSGAEGAAMAAPSASMDHGQAPSGGGPAPDVTGEPEIAAGAAAEPNAAPTGTDAFPGPTSAEPAAGPWTEPALPGLPAGVPPSASQRAAWGDEASPDDALVPRPDPAWPRLFGQRAGDQASSDSGEAVQPEGQAAAPVRDADPAAQREHPTAQGEARPDEAALAPGRGGAGSPPDENLESDAGPWADAGEARSTGPRDGSAADRLPGPTPTEGGAASVLAGAHPVEVASEDDVAAQSDQVAVVDLTTGDPEDDRDLDLWQGPRGEAVAQPTPEAAAVHGGAQAAEQANISTVAPTAEADEADAREASPGPSGDVSRETFAGGGEEMESHEDEVVEDEAAVAVREAVSRAAAEAGVDVSRETEMLAEEPPVDGLVGEPSVDSEAAAKNARVTFRIHREALNGTRRVMAVANQKGGVGKSTTAVNIGAYLALAGARVLVVDLDPQGNASTGLGLDHREIEPSIYDVLTGEAPTTAAIRPTSVANLHVLPSTIDLAGAEVELVSAMSRETRLRRALESIDHQYDTVLIDCPPSLGLLTVNALAAANELLIPIQCEYYALEGLGQLLRNVELVRANLNPELRIGGIVLTMYDGRTRLALQVVEEVRKHFTDIVYQTVVPRSVRLSEAPGYGVPIALYDPLSRGGIAYRDLTFELAERTGLLAPTGEGAS
jgi:chromosome partitioning protein